MKKRIKSNKATAPITEPTIFGTDDEGVEVPLEPESVLSGPEDDDVGFVMGAPCVNDDSNDDDVGARDALPASGAEDVAFAICVADDELEDDDVRV